MAQTKIIYEKLSNTGLSTHRENYTGNISKVDAQRMMEKRHPGCKITVKDVKPM